MDPARFAAWTRRRFGIAAGGTLAAALGLPLTDRARAKKKKLKRNAFGCVDVGGKCRGKDTVCCSGICQGKTPKQGEKDRSRCVAHDTGGCQAGQQGSFCGGTNVECTTSTSTTPNGVCDTTTGNAGYCAFTTTCSPCRKDADCIPVCGLGAACVRCATCLDDGGTRCVGTGPEACLFD